MENLHPVYTDLRAMLVQCARALYELTVVKHVSNKKEREGGE